MRLNSVVIADDSADDIGELCVMMKDATTRLLAGYASKEFVELYNTECLSDSISQTNLADKLSPINNTPFLCFWYGHGEDKAFLVNHEHIVTTTLNHYLFSNALVYTFSCLNGGKLADVLINNKVKTFIGYTGDANCPLGIDEITNDIAMSFVSSFLSGKTTSESFDDLKESYERAVFDNTLDPLQRSYYQENRDALVLKGDESVTISDVLVEKEK